jgi:hypothetical protein
MLKQSTDQTPSGTPTSTTTSLSTLSTTAIKDGHRGHLHASATGRGHSHNPSTTSLEAERADRISRLAGLERVSTLRPQPYQFPHQNNQLNATSPQTTPTSTVGFPQYNQANPYLAPATYPYFDANGQPVAVNKMSTVGSASATDSYNGDDARTQPGDHDQDEDMMSMDTSYRDTADSVTSMGTGVDPMDEDLDAMATRSVGGYEDRMSDDGSASLVGFGEGAGSTVSGPIYHRRPIPGMVAPGGPPGVWTLERSSSGMSDGLPRRDREFPMGSDTPVSASAIQERREARMVDGVAADAAGVPEEEMFVDTTTRGPIPVSQLQQHSTTSREAAERIVCERLDGGEARVGGAGAALGSPGKGVERLGKFYFEERN